MRLLLLSDKTEAAQLLTILHQERIYYDLLSRATYMAHPPFSTRIYNGALIEEKLITQCSIDDLNTFELLKKVLPCQIIMADPDPAHKVTLATFFETCQRFPARSIRLQTRSNLCLPAVVTSEADSDKLHKVNTYNISQNGCFLTNPLNKKIGDKIWINLDRLEDSSPLLSEIRWFSQDSTADLPPGMGVRFLEASSSQRKQLDSLIHKR